MADEYNQSIDTDPNAYWAAESARRQSGQGQTQMAGVTSGAAQLSPETLINNYNATATGTSSSTQQPTTPSQSTAPATEAPKNDNPYSTGLSVAPPPPAAPPAQPPASTPPPANAAPATPASAQPAAGSSGNQAIYDQIMAMLRGAPQASLGQNGSWSAPGVSNWYTAQSDFGNPGGQQLYAPSSFQGVSAALTYPQQVQQLQQLLAQYGQGSGAGTPWENNQLGSPAGQGAGTQTAPPPANQQYSPAQGTLPPGGGGGAATPGNTQIGPTGPQVGDVPRGTSGVDPTHMGPAAGQGLPPALPGSNYIPPQQQQTGNSSGIPNSYNPFNVQRPAYNYQPSAYQFAGNNGTGSPYPVTGAGDKQSIQPSLSPGLTASYFQFLQNQATNAANGYGATPYGQQSVYLPGFGQSSMQGLTSPIDPQLLAATGAINSSVQTQANALPDINALQGRYNPAQQQVQYGANAANANYQNPQNLAQQYKPLLQGANAMQQFGGMGYPGQGLSLESQYGAIGNDMTGAGALQGAAAGTGTPGLPGQYLNAATNTGGFGTPGQLQTQLAQSGTLQGQGNQTLNSMAQTGNPVDQTAAWQAQNEALSRKRNQDLAQIAEHSAQTGNLAGAANGGGTGYNQAVTDYMTQANRDQTAQLLAAQNSASENAANRQLQAGNQLQQGQIGALNNLSNTQNQAGLYGAGSQLTSSALMQNQIAQALQQMNQNQQFGLSQGANTLGQSQLLPANIANQSANTMLNAGNSQAGVTNSQITQPYGVFNQGMQTLGGLQGQMANQGQYYQGMDQNAINALRDEFMRTQSEYSPLLGQMFQGATTFPGVLPPNATSGLGALVGQIGGQLIAPGGVLNPNTPNTPNPKP